MNVLSINPGSYTVKSKLIRSEDEQILKEDYRYGVKGEQVVDAVRDLLDQEWEYSIDRIGIRVVQGGQHHRNPEVVSANLLADLRDLIPLDPEHLPTALAVIETIQEIKPETPLIAIFDTQFHQTLPDAAAIYAIGVDEPERYRRLGFHGLAYQYVSKEYFRVTQRLVPGSRLIALHLGGGASACAIYEGKSIDTTMGLTPLEGLVMSTRSGDVDPGLVLQLIREGRSCDEVSALLNQKSGLLGLAGFSADINDLEPAADSGNEKAKLALQVYHHRCRRYLGAMLAVLGGCDAVLLSGGLVKDSATFRAKLFQGLEGLGFQLDAERNQQTSSKEATRISTEQSAVEIWMMPAEEELEMAREVSAMTLASE